MEWCAGPAWRCAFLDDSTMTHFDTFNVQYMIRLLANSQSSCLKLCTPAPFTCRYVSWLEAHFGLITECDRATAACAVDTAPAGPGPGSEQRSETAVPIAAAKRLRQVVVFSDRPAEALDALRRFGAVSPSEALGAGRYGALVGAFGGGADGEALADFFLLSRCVATAPAVSRLNGAFVLTCVHDWRTCV